MTDKPMNPYASKDFENAIREASENLKKMGEQMKADFPFMDDPYVAFVDMDEEYCGTMRLKTSDMWERITDYLTDAGYEVTIRKEDATETEKELDGVNEWVVIEYGEVE